MREILFHGKRIDSGEWVEGNLICWPDGDAEICTPSVSSASAMIKILVNPATIGQYTGMTDKNGKRIFEGDILRIKERGYTVDGGVVFFENGYPGGWLIKDAGKESKCSLAMRTDVEVIGNIHDNPELLKGDTDHD